MKKFFSALWSRTKLIVREAFNIATNVLTPAVATVAILLEILCVPKSVIHYVKVAEDWLYKFAGTKKIIDEVIEVVDEAVGE